jgi:hypothetical protein
LLQEQDIERLEGNLKAKLYEKVPLDENNNTPISKDFDFYKEAENDKCFPKLVNKSAKPMLFDSLNQINKLIILKN